MKNLFVALLTSLGLAGCNSQKKGAPPTTKIDFDELSRESYEYLKINQAKIQQDYNLGSYERYDWDQEKMQLIWSDAGVAKVVADIQFVGSTSTKSKTWLWSWANSTILKPLSKGMLIVKDFGLKHGLTKLTERKWSAEEVDGWEMTAIAAKILNAKGAYRSPDSSGFIFMIFTEIDFAEGYKPNNANSKDSFSAEHSENK